MPLIPPGGLSPISNPELGAVPAQQPPPAILADAIDPATGDFASLFVGRSLADAFAIEALRVERGTGAAVRELGNRFRQVSHVEPSSAGLIESMANEAFADAETAGVARLVRVSVAVDELDGSQISATLEYRDLLAPAESADRRLVFAL